MTWFPTYTAVTNNYKETTGTFQPDWKHIILPDSQKSHFQRFQGGIHRFFGQS